MTIHIPIDDELFEYLTLEKKYREWMATKYSPNKNEIKKVTISFSNLIREKFFLPLMYGGNRYPIKKKVKLIKILENLVAIFKKLDPHSIEVPVWLTKMDLVYRSHYSKEDVERGLDYLKKNGYIEEIPENSYYIDGEKNTIQPIPLLFIIDSRSGFLFEDEEYNVNKKDKNPPKKIPIQRKKENRLILPEEFEIEDTFKYSWARNKPLDCMPLILEDLKSKK